MQRESPEFDEEWDAGDLGCGDLVIRLRFRLKAMQPGEVIRVHATDPGAREDLPAWCRMTGETLLAHDPDRHLYFIQRAGG
ncbi:MAG: sulfurtransferase TusA family protein [Burkholderiales bacterium]|nr:sulfurtransferase TusA family protein [Burkholderiales bacterium]